MAVPSDTSPEKWLADLDRLVSSGPTESCRVTTGTGVVAGEEATITQHRCPDMVYIGRNLTHSGRGYSFTMGFAPGDMTSRATLEGIVASIGFADQ